MTAQTFTFIGVSTGASAATRLFPAWARELGLGDVRLVGCDLPLHAPREQYREVVMRIKGDESARGALVTTHKIDLFDACRDLFDSVDDNAELLGEASALARHDGALHAFATDPVSAGRALDDFYPAHAHSEVLCLGGGGAATAITVELLTRRAVSRVTVVDVDAERLSRLRTTHHKVDLLAPARYVQASDAAVNDRLVGDLPPYSLVINATGLGKDLPGSPITDAAIFPEFGSAWDVNYRGDLQFLRQARAQQERRHLRVEDGWRYFIHGWAAVMSRVFDVYIGPDETARLAAIAEPERPRTTIRP